MTQVNSRLSTGLPGLDKTLRGLIPGDNVVWQVDSVEDYGAMTSIRYGPQPERQAGRLGLNRTGLI